MNKWTGHCYIITVWGRVFFFFRTEKDDKSIGPMLFTISLPGKDGIAVLRGVNFKVNLTPHNLEFENSF